MAFIVHSGNTKVVQLPVTASTALAADSLVTFTSGRLVAATAGTTAVNIVGILQAPITASDADYAATRNVGVLVPVDKHVVYECDVTSGLVAADVGLEQDITSATHINRGASAIDVAKCIGVLSATKGLFWLRINGSY